MKKLLAVILAFAMLLSLAACGQQGEDPAATGGEEELGLIGFCSVSLSESIYVLTQEALEAKFEGKAVVQTVSCDNDSATQISQIKTFVTMGADMIIINPTDIDALSDAIIEAHNAGVKVYINGATSDSLSDEYYDCCTVSNEYLIGAYVALIAKNWIEAHADELTAANPNWEVAFLQSSLSEETLERSAGEMAILEPYLKDYEGNYIDISGNVVDEANKVENPAYCQIAAERYKGVIVEQDQTNGGLNVANILTTNPNTRVFIAYNSLASTQGGQYIVDNYPDQIDEFAFFSSGVMGNEADYMVGAVSDTDGVTPSVMRGACQFGVSAAGGEVADSVANTAYAIMYGTEGVDYVKNNIDGIAAWWTVDEEWGNGTASVAHFNILSGATVQAFDPIGALTDENTVIYWNSKDGFIVEEAPVDDVPVVDEPNVTPGAYTYEYEGQGGLETAEFDLADDGTCKFYLPGHPFITDEYAGTYTREGNVVTITGLKHVDPASPYQIPGLWDFIDAATGDATITVNDKDGTFVPGAAAAPAAVAVTAGEYTYLEATPFGEMKWVITLNEDGTAVFGQPENAGMGNPTWTAVWTDNGDGTFTTAECVGDGPQIAFFWENNSIVWQLLNDNCAVPVKADDYAAHVDAHGIPTGETAAAGIAAGEYTFMETTPYGEMKWVVTLNEDGTAIVAQPENAGMGNPTWTAVWTDNGDGTFTTAECVGDGPQIASFWNNNSITWINNGDGTVTPVGYNG